MFKSWWLGQLVIPWVHSVSSFPAVIVEFAIKELHFFCNMIKTVSKHAQWHLKQQCFFIFLFSDDAQPVLTCHQRELDRVDLSVCTPAITCLLSWTHKNIHRHVLSPGFVWAQSCYILSRPQRCVCVCVCVCVCACVCACVRVCVCV